MAPAVGAAVDLYAGTRMTMKGIRGRSPKGPPALLIALAASLAACAGDAGEGGGSGTPPAGTDEQAVVRPAQPRQEIVRTPPRPDEDGSAEHGSSREKPRSGERRLGQLTPAELRREARRLFGRAEPRPKAETQRRAVEQLFARAQRIERRYRGHARTRRQSTDQLELQRRAETLRDQFRQPTP